MGFKNLLTLSCRTDGRGFYELTQEVNNHLSTQPTQQAGLCHLYIPHTSASLLITENADPQVLVDLESFMSRLVVDGDPLFRHTAEGADDMPAHIRSSLTQTMLTIPFDNQRLLLGTWQGIYLWEHRTSAHVRQVTMSLMT